ncbi:PREDICTED: chondroitin sulfate synthase 1-like [Priapulus caudatus]|uniref:Hexosyltransferase n=1 Tax=Priapulus caudatus TaxID=37621 RepID=A0ABM1E6N5_PRICU|nr:PREDICTED: chondroitin sulfate synthase 1-like [Priapulus caudatus]
MFQDDLEGDQMQTILFHNSTERKEDERESFTGDLYTPEVIQATTLHPFKVTAHLYRAHAFFHALKTRDLRHKTLLLQRDVRDMDVLLGDRTGGATYVDDALGLHSGLNKFRPRSRESVLTWNFMSRAVYAAGGYQPKCGFDQALKHSLQDIVMQVMFMINKHSRQRGRVIDFREILYGYYRHDPRHGADYIVDILLTYKKYAGRKMTVPVRRHAYIQQAFTAPEFREEMPDPSPPPSEHQGAPPRDGADFNSGDADLPTAAAAAAGGAQTTVHFVLPLAGRYTTFKRFLSNFESACLRGEERVTLAVILFTHAYEDRRDDTVAAVATLRAKYPRYDLQTVHAAGAFSRGLALQIGARLRRADALLFFVDVDIYFSRDFLERARLNARRGVSVYFPIVFSQYNPRTVDAGEERDVFSIDDDVGYWREFGYGIACVYNSDLHVVGGFDLTIEGWGREDVDLFERFLASGNVTVVRAPDPGLVHIYHDKTCDPGLDAAQLTMCRGSDTNGYGSTRRLADVVYARPDLLGMTDEDDDEDGDAT